MMASPSTMEKEGPCSKLEDDSKPQESDTETQTQLLHDRRELYPRYSSGMGYGEGQVAMPLSGINESGEDLKESGVSTPESIRCSCHKKPAVDSTTRKAVLKLVVALLIALFFMVGEVIGKLLEPLATLLFTQILDYPTVQITLCLKDAS